MNNRMYWIIRKILMNIVFAIKKLFYRILDYITGIVEYKSFGRLLIKYTIKELFKGIVFSACILVVDCVFLNKDIFSALDRNIFVPVVVGGIGIAGLILGLYCSNIATIYSSRYANAPRIIAKIFQEDRLTRKCISGITEYITFGLVILYATTIKVDVGWIVAGVFVLWSVAVIISYSIAGNRTYQLSDIYSLADNPNTILYRIITKRINKKMFVTDTSFQNHFLIVAEKQIDILKSIQKYGESINISDYTTMIEFMCKNLAIIDIYWKKKKEINKLSLWFRNKPQYPRWHMSDNTESSLALRTGTSLRTKEEHDYFWIEDELFSINKACVNFLVNKKDFKSIYTYLLAFDGICRTAIESKEANYYVTQVDWLKQAIEKSASDEILNEEDKKTYLGLVDVISLLYLNLILETSKIYQDFNFDSIITPILKSIDNGDDFENSLSLRGRGNKDYYEKIITEVKIEGKRITPDWVIKQQVAKEEYVYLNSLLDIVEEGMDHVFNLGKYFLDKGLYFEACILFTRFYEYESKITRLIDVVNNRKIELEEYHIDKALIWDKFRLDNLKETMNEWKKQVPVLLSDSSSKFVLENWENREDYPDFLGESYNHICEDAVEAIITDNLDQFIVDYDNLSKLMLLYFEYIRLDFVKKNNLYRAEYTYYILTSPIVEWAQIGGLAVLWGEFHSDTKWKECVSKSANAYFFKNGINTDLPEKLIDYIQYRNRFMLGIGNRDILENRWQLDVVNAIRESGICEKEYYPFYGMTLKTDSKLLKVFCPSFFDLGFSIDPSEVFWAVCVNPLLPKEKRFKTSREWDKELKNDLYEN